MTESAKTSERDEKMRVKLYMLNAGRAWDDQGTGYVSSTFSEKTKNMFLIVKEENKNTVLLESKIQLTTAYQKQQETLIVWSEADNFDYALSFQNKAGCDEIWAQICQVQGKDPSVDVTQEISMEHDDAEIDDDRFESMSSSHLGSDNEGGGRLTMSLPPCEISKLDDIVDLLQTSLPSQIKRERLSELLEQENYVSKLVELFRMSEDLEDVASLRRLYTIFKSLFFLNKSPVFEAMFADDVIFDVIGALEYDPNQPRRIPHREFLKRQASLIQAVPFHNPELIQKIHQTYRVQYIQDAILPAPSMFEENMLTTLTSFVYFNKVEIVTHIQEDEKYLQTMFKHLVDEDTDDLTRRNIMSFLKEFCNMSCNLTPQNREEFFKVLTNLGILNALQIVLGLDDVVSRWLAVDIFSNLVEFNSSIVRDHFLKEIHKQEDEDLLINMVIEQMFTDLDPELGGALQLIGVIRLLLDPDNMNSIVKNEKTDFLSNFYSHCMHVLTAPLFANTANDKPSKDDYQTAQMQALILELLTFCVEHHTYHIKIFMINKHLLKRSLTLLSSRHGFLQLAALRLLRRTISLKEEFYFRHIIKFDLLGGVVDAFVRNGNRYNLLNSAIIELFEFIKTEDIRSLMDYLVRRHINSFEGVSYVQTFNAIKHKYLHCNNNLSSSADSLDFLSTTPLKPDQSMDEDEESWFNQEDEAEDIKLTPTKLDNYTPKFSPRNNCSIGTLGRSPIPLYNNNKRNNTISFNLNFRQNFFNKALSNNDNTLSAPMVSPHLTDLPLNNKSDFLQKDENIKNSADASNSKDPSGFANDSEKCFTSSPSNLSSPSLSPSSSTSLSPFNRSMFYDSSLSSSPLTSPQSTSSPLSTSKPLALKGLVDYDYEEDEDEEDLGDDSQLSKDKNVNKNSSDNVKNVSVENNNQDVLKEHTQVANEEVFKDKEKKSACSQEGGITNSVENCIESEMKADSKIIDEEEHVETSEPTFKTALTDTVCDQNNSVSTTSESSLHCQNIIDIKDTQNTSITSTDSEDENKTEMNLPDSCTNANVSSSLDNTSLVKTIDICSNSKPVNENELENVDNEKNNASLKRQSNQNLDVDSKKAKLHL